MTGTRETKIRQALVYKAQSVAAQLGRDLSLPSFNFTKPLDKPFIIFNYIPNTVSRLYMGSDESHEYNGLIQMDVMCPIWNDGDSAAFSANLAGQIIELFAEDEKLDLDGIAVTIVNRGRIAPSYRDDTMWRTPVVIEWRCLG